LNWRNIAISRRLKILNKLLGLVCKIFGVGVKKQVEELEGKVIYRSYGGGGGD
jgi:hypothetical protein